MPILIISKWLKPVARDQTFWQSDEKSYIYWNTQHFFSEADSGHNQYSSQNGIAILPTNEQNLDW